MWYILLFIIYSVVGKAIYHNEVPGYLCRSDNHCTDYIPNSMCFNNKCVCQIRFESDGFSRCVHELRYRRQINFGIQMLGEECQSNDECRRTPVDGTKVCALNRCQCSPGHVPVDAYRCIRDFEQLSGVTQTTKPSQIEELAGYGSACTIHSDCQQVTIQLECFQGTCACLEGYVPLGKYLCYNIRGQDATITESSTDTSAPSKTTSAFISPSDETAKSLGKLGNLCTDDYYCRRSVTQSHCYNGQCSCINGYISIDSYSCIEDKNEDLPTNIAAYNSVLEGKCKTNLNCYIANSICLNNICTCGKGYFAIDSWHCLPDSDSSSEELTSITMTIPTTTTITTTAATTTTTTTTTMTPPTTTSFLWWPWSSSTTAAATTTTGFLWWPWLSSPTTRQPLINLQNTFAFRCILHRQCISIDRNSHCALFGRCVCNYGYRLHSSMEGPRCFRTVIHSDADDADDDCD